MLVGGSNLGNGERGNGESVFLPLSSSSAAMSLELLVLLKRVRGEKEEEDWACSLICCPFFFSFHLRPRVVVAAMTQTPLDPNFDLGQQCQCGFVLFALTCIVSSLNIHCIIIFYGKLNITLPVSKSEIPVLKQQGSRDFSHFFFFFSLLLS